MKKKFFSVVCALFLISCFSTPAFAASGSCSVSSSIPTNYSLPLQANQSVDISFSINTASYAGQLIEIPLLGNYASGDTSGVAYLSTFEGVAWGVRDVVDGAGLPVPFWVNGNTLVVVPNNTGVSYTSFVLSISADKTVGSLVENLVTVNGSVKITVHGQASAMSLAQFLNAFHLQLDHITNNTADIERYGEVMSYYITYLESIANNTGQMNSNLNQILSNLSWIVSEMEGNAVGVLMGEYAGYNYSQLLVEMINSIKNISIGDITGDLNVQIDLSEVLNNLVTIAKSYNNINQFDYRGKMYFIPSTGVSVLSSGSAKTPVFSYSTLGDLPAFSLDANVSGVKTLNLKTGAGTNSVINLMPGKYRVSIRVETMSADVTGSYLYFYNSTLPTIALDWTSYNSSITGLTTYSTMFELDCPSGMYGASMQFSFPANASGGYPDLTSSRWVVEYERLDYVDTELLAAVQGLIGYVNNTNNLLTSIGMDLQALLDFLVSDEYFAQIEEQLSLLLEEQKISNETLQAILAVLEDIREYIQNREDSGPAILAVLENILEYLKALVDARDDPKPDTGATDGLGGVLNTVLGGVVDIIGRLLTVVVKTVFKLFSWISRFIGWINGEYLGGFFPAPVWAVVSVLLPLIVVLGLIRFIRGVL